MMKDASLWWQLPLRVIQTNLQVLDTPRMNPAKIAGEIEEMAANTLVFNVGGIYAWYESEVKYHHINEYLPKDFDLLAEMIKECHARGIKFVARFDFSKTDDYVYQEKPQWFVRDAEGKPRIYGRDRFGVWSMLLTTCINGGYRGEELAVPVIEEVIAKYEIDGIFFNAPNYEFCHCDACKQKYRALYGKELPLTAKELASLLGVEPGMTRSEYLAASYLRFEPPAGDLALTFEETPIIAHRGVVGYCTPNKETAVLATLVPPFAPLDAVGAPPERASILTPNSQLPLVMLARRGAGLAMYLPFQLSTLAREFKLGEHYRLMKNAADLLLGEAKAFDMEPCGRRPGHGL